MTDREFCVDFVEHNAIYRCSPGTFIPGKNKDIRYTWQFYLRRAQYNSLWSKIVAQMFWERFLKEYQQTPFQMALVESAGPPLGVAIQQYGLLYHNININAFVIRKSRKDYGLHNQTEGIISDEPIMIVDDVSASGSTIQIAHDMLINQNLQTYHTYYCLLKKMTFDLATPDPYLSMKKVYYPFLSTEFTLSWSEYVSKYGIEPSFTHWF